MGEAAAITLESVAFTFGRGHGPIPLRAPDTMEELGASPEWVRGGRNVPAAFAAGTTPRLQVILGGGPDALPEGATIAARATGPGFGVTEAGCTVRRAGAGKTVPLELVLDRAVGPGIGVHDLELHWQVRVGSGAWTDVGATTHRLYSTWRRTLPASHWLSNSERRALPPGTIAEWAYEPVVALTCRWAAGAGDAKGICDAILQGLQGSPFQYAVGAWNVRDMLAKQGGYCGGWYRMFQALAGSQGVHVERRSVLVDWRVQPDGESRWCALVVRAPGLNRSEPAEGPSVFHDEDERKRGGDVTTVTQARYRFWGHPGRVADGHCVNFLAHEGHWYLYDVSFLDEAVPLEGFHLPPVHPKGAIPTEALGNFKQAYLDRAVDHMLGGIRVGGKFYQTLHPDPDHPQFNSAEPVNGLTMRTAIIPDRDRHITFIWTG